MEKQMYLLMLILITVLTSCSSNSPKVIVPFDDISQYQNADFLPKKTVRYSKRSDQYEGELSLLKNETMARTYDQSDKKDAEDPIRSIAIACYRADFENADNLIKNNYAKYRLHPAYWNQIGNCSLRKNEKIKAVIYYNKALDKDEKYPPAFNNQGVVHQINGDDQAAYVLYQKANSLSPNASTPVFNMALIEVKYGFYQKAITHLNALLRLDSKDIETLSAMGSAQLLSGDYKKAIAYYERIPNSLKSRPSIGIYYSAALYFSGEKDKARSLFSSLNGSGYEEQYNIVKGILEER